MGDRCGVCLEEVTDRGVLDSCEHAFCFDWCGFLASSHPCSPGERSALAWAECESRCPLCKSLTNLLIPVANAESAGAFVRKLWVEVRDHATHSFLAACPALVRAAEH